MGVIIFIMFSFINFSYIVSEKSQHYGFSYGELYTRNVLYLPKVRMHAHVHTLNLTSNNSKLLGELWMK